MKTYTTVIGSQGTGDDSGSRLLLYTFCRQPESKSVYRESGKENSKQTDAKPNERVTCNPFNFIYYCFLLSMSIKYALCLCYEQHRRTHKINIKLGDLNITFALLSIWLYCSNFSWKLARKCDWKLKWVVKLDKVVMR